MRKMKNQRQLSVVIVIAVFLIHSRISSAQIESFSDLPQYLNPEFSASRVKMKVGKDLSLMLNYNMVTEKMVFFQKDNVYDMLNQGSVDTIYMGGSMFIPYEKVFYEVYPGTPVSLFIQHKGRIQSPPKPAGYGGTSEVSSSSYISRIDLGSQVYNMKLEGGLRVKYDPVYWVRVNDKMISFTSEKLFLKIFPEKEAELKQYIKKNRLKFEKPADLLKIWKYTNEILK
jgi:hypothetical protein